VEGFHYLSKSTSWKSYVAFPLRNCGGTSPVRHPSLKKWKLVCVLIEQEMKAVITPFHGGGA